jgi:hypothetical protein
LHETLLCNGGQITKKYKIIINGCYSISELIFELSDEEYKLVSSISAASVAAVKNEFSPTIQVQEIIKN